MMNKSSPISVYSFPKANETSHKLSGLNNRSTLSQSYEGCKSEIKVSMELIFSKGCEEESVACPSLASDVLLAVFGVLGFWGITMILASTFTCIIAHVHACLSVQISPTYEDTSPSGFECYLHDFFLA